jgi:AraC-like DNA-binding protein
MSLWDDVRNANLLESFDPRERQLKDLAIAELGVSTRAADAAATALKRGRFTRDFFVLKTTVAAANRTLQRSELDVSQFGKPHLGTRSSDHPSSSQDGIILALQRNAFGVREPEKPGLQIIPFPYGTVSLINLALDPTARPEDKSDCFNFLIPRATFDQLADDHGADRIVELAVRPGVAASDPIALHLLNCLMPAIDRHDGVNDHFVDHVATAFNIHFARVYGSMHFPRPFVSGGLAPWQLRLVREAVNANLEEQLSVERIARECKLSVNYFAKAFTRSIGVAPHRWLMQRRVDVAKDLMLTTDCSLVEISLKCGFSDQSHFTRVFTKATGETPGRWRQIQLNWSATSAFFDTDVKRDDRNERCSYVQGSPARMIEVIEGCGQV